MEPVIENLYASTASPLPFAPSEGIRAFLLRRDAGNLLVYSAPTVDAGAVGALGGATQILIGHWHETEFGGGDALASALGAPLAGERAAPIAVDGDDVAVIPMSGHTPGATAFLWHGVLFTGDTVYLRDGEWAGAVLESSDRAAYVESLERLRELEFEWLVPWAASLDGPFAAATDRADARRRLDALIARVRAGGSG
jgi:glyoxylase-like metal-dependent hydrolase (beta-lactamase superfamily II)